MSDDDPYVSHHHFLLEIAPPRTSSRGIELGSSVDSDAILAGQYESLQASWLCMWGIKDLIGTCLTSDLTSISDQSRS